MTCNSSSKGAKLDSAPISACVIPVSWLALPRLWTKFGLKHFLSIESLGEFMLFIVPNG